MMGLYLLCGMFYIIVLSASTVHKSGDLLMVWLTIWMAVLTLLWPISAVIVFLRLTWNGIRYLSELVKK